MRRTAWVASGAAVAVGALVVAAIAFNRSPSAALARSDVDNYLRAWERFDARAMAKQVDHPPSDFATAVANMRTDLHVGKAEFRIVGLHRDSRSATTALFHADLRITGLGAFAYDGSLPWHRVNGTWKVVWSPSTLHPQLAPGLRFAVTRTRPVRAAILGSDGQPLVAQADVVTVGLEPDRITDRTAVNTAFQQVLQIPAATIDAALARPGVKPNFFVPITTLRPDRFAAVRAQLDPVPGVFFQKSKARQAVTDGLASHVLGQVGEITAERLKQLGDLYQVGDTVGLSGLEAVFEQQLAGTPSGDVHLVDAFGRTPAVLQQYTGTPSAPVSTTLDAALQTAAEHALDGVTQPAALVAIDAGSGDIRAVVSRPTADAFDRALAGLYPPGSTAKVMTAAALLAHGTTADTAASCPPSAVVGGKTFTNFEGEAPGQIPFHQAFAISCNTAFVGLAAALPGSALVDAARAFGFDGDDKLPLTTARPQYPLPKDDAEKAAEAIGQGRVVTTPLHMATVAAAVAGGAWHPPRLLESDAAGVARPLDAGVAATLRSLMLEVVRSGTGTPAAVPGQAIGGKTGTAEFGNGNPPATHAWFIGFRGSLAFAIVVEGGGVGGRVAAPIANRFLAAAPTS